MTREEQIAYQACKQRSISQERAFIDGAQWADEHPRWISVEDKLPPLRQRVLVNNGVTNYIAWVLEDGSWVADAHKEWEKECFRLYSVTHWMPLPTPPKKGGKR